MRGLFRTAPEHTANSPVAAADPIVADPALLQAIKAEDVTAVETLLKKGSNPRGRVGSQKIPLLTIVELKLSVNRFRHLRSCMPYSTPARTPKPNGGRPLKEGPQRK